MAKSTASPGQKERESEGLNLKIQKPSLVSAQAMAQTVNVRMFSDIGWDSGGWIGSGAISLPARLRAGRGTDLAAQGMEDRSGWARVDGWVRPSAPTGRRGAEKGLPRPEQVAQPVRQDRQQEQGAHGHRPENGRWSTTTL